MTNRQRLTNQEFELDSKVRAAKETIKKYEVGEDISDSVLYEARLKLELDEPKLRNVQRKLYGWRNVTQLYGEVEGLGSVEFLRKEVLRLEGQEIDFEKTLNGYRAEEKRLQEKIKDLQEKRTLNVGHVPDSREVEEAQEELLDLHRRAATASAGLPLTQSQLEHRRKELAALEKKIEYAKKYSDGKTYSSPGDEVAGRIQTYMDEHKTADHSVAMKAVLEADPFLADAYINR
jgi:hypothetical protein